MATRFIASRWQPARLTDGEMKSYSFLGKAWTAVPSG
jgi:hypothetical protein